MDVATEDNGDADVQSHEDVLSPLQTSNASVELDRRRSRFARRYSYQGQLVPGGSYTAGDVIDYIGTGRLQYFLLLLLGATALVHGMDTSFFSFVPAFAGCAFNISLLDQSFVSVVYLLGLSIGSLVFGFLSDLTGRKAALVSSVVLLIIISTLGIITVAVYLLLAFRFISGFAIGGLAIRTTWIFECLPGAMRPQALIALVFFWQLGMIVVLPILMVAEKSLNYAVMGIHLPLLAVVVLLMVMPESPRFLAEAQLCPEALDTLVKFAKQRKVTLPKITIISERERQRRLRAQKGGSCSDSEEESPPEKGNFQGMRFIKEMLRHGERRRTTLLLGVAWFSVYFCFFGHHLATVEWFAILTSTESHGITLSHVPLQRCVDFTWKDYVALILISTCSLPGLLLFVWMIEKWGRRRSLVITSVVGGLVLPLSVIPGVDRIGLTLILSVQRAAVSATLQILFVYTAEVYATHIRSFANGVLLSFGLLGAVFAPFFSQFLLRSSLVAHAAVVVFCVASFGSAVACYYLPLESYGNLLEE